MIFVPFRNWTCLFLLGLLFVAVSGQTVLGNNGGAIRQKSCDEIRQQNTEMFLRANGRKVPAPFMDQLIPQLVELFLPRDCVKNLDPAIKFNPSSGQDHGGPLGTLGWNGNVFTTGQLTRAKRSVDNEDGSDDNMDLNREKRSADDEFAELEDVIGLREKRSADETDNDFADLEGDLLREKRSADDGDVTNNVDDSMALTREKRFLNGMTLGAPTAGPTREVSESAQMMNTLLMLTRLQRKQASMTYRKAGRSGFYGDRQNFGSGMYGDSYPGRKKRAATSDVEENMVEFAEPKSRTKRFLFPAAEPAEGPPMPSMMSVMMGTARDPNTGKKIEFGGDNFKRMMTSNFMSTMPADARPPPGKEPSDMVKNMAPVWYFSRMRMAMNPQVRRYMSDPSDYPVVRTSGYVQRRQKSGYYGDALPGKKRRKRSSGDNSDTSSNTDVITLERIKRQSESTNNDVVTIGDVTIPVDFFKPREISDDIKHNRQPHPQRPYQQQSYHQPAYQRSAYQQPRPQYYHGNYVQNPRYRALYNSRYQQAKVIEANRKIYQFVKALYDKQQYQKYLARIQQQRTKSLPRASTQWNQPVPQYSPPVYSSPVAPQSQPLAPQIPAPQSYAPPLLPQTNQFVPIPNAPHQSAPLAPAAPAPVFNVPLAQPPVPSNPLAPAPVSNVPLAQPPVPSIPLAPAPVSNVPLAQPPVPSKPLAPAPVSNVPLAQPPVPSNHFPSNYFTPLQPNPPMPFAPPPPQTFGRPIAPPIDPFLPPAPPQNPVPPKNSQHHRHKRSDNKDNPESRRGNFFYNPFITPALTPYIPPRYSGRSNKIGYASPRGGVVYGDRLPWAPRGRTAPRSPYSPAAFSAFLRRSQALKNRAAPVTWNQPRPTAPSRGGRRRVKRSDNKDNPESRNNFLFPPPLFPPIYSAFTPLYTPFSNYVPPRYSGRSNKIGYASPRGGVVYGDRLPWAPRTSPVLRRGRF